MDFHRVKRNKKKLKSFAEKYCVVIFFESFLIYSNRIDSTEHTNVGLYVGRYVCLYKFSYHGTVEKDRKYVEL